MRQLRAILPIAMTVALAACTNAGAEGDQFAQAQLSPEQAAEIEGICSLPAGTLTGAAPIADMREAAPKIACAVEEGRKRNLSVGFISNPVDPNAQTH